MASYRESQGRSIAEVVGRMREAITGGQFGSGRFLPPVRELCRAHKVSAETVRRGLKVLEDEGLLVAKARRGFRVAPRSAADVGHRPIAYVTEHDAKLATAQPANWALMSAFQQAMTRTGSSVLGVHTGGGDGVTLIEQIRAGQAWGVALDTQNPELVDAARSSGLPLVQVNSCQEGGGVDTVVQDNYCGGFLAARHLLEAGCRRIAWFGALGQYYHSRERFAGASAALAAAGRYFDESTRVEVEGPGSPARALELLSRAERPDGILAFSAGTIAVLRQACRQLNITLERDVRIVGWVVEEQYPAEYAPLFGDGRPSPAVVWKAATMVERALALLSERRAGRIGEPVRVCVPARLKLGDG